MFPVCSRQHNQSPTPWPRSAGNRPTPGLSAFSASAPPPRAALFRAPVISTSTCTWRMPPSLPREQLPLELYLRIHRDLAQIDPAPFRYIDAGVERIAPLETARAWVSAPE